MKSRYRPWGSNIRREPPKRCCATVPPGVAIAHPRLHSGGSEARALWGAEALKQDFDVTLITSGPVDLDRLNRYYGTNLRANEFSIRTVRMPFGLHNTPKFAGLRGAFYGRYLKSAAPEFDVMISAYNVCDFGVPGIQFIADFSFMREWRESLHPALANYRRWWYGDSPFRRAYLGLCDSIAGPRTDGWKQNLTVANSDWSAAILRHEFGIEARIVYPPVAGNFPDIPWEQRENGFVCIGRVVPEKRMDMVIEILSRARQRGHDVHLHILGGVDDSPFGRKMKELAQQNRGWLFLEGWVAGKRKQEILAAHLFGINNCQNEAFGIAPAEMVKAGCITFVPDSGGQTEIVDHPALTFANGDDAVEKIDAVLTRAELRQRLRDHLSRQARKFSVENFQSGFRSVVYEFLEEKQKRAEEHASPAEASLA